MYILKHRNGWIMGVKWDKGASPALTRTYGATGMVANVGIDNQVVRNDFDTAPFFRNMIEDEDSMGNRFISIPEIYIKKVDEVSNKEWLISNRQYDGFYLPYNQWDFTNGRKLPYFLFGKYNANLDSGGTKLESKSGNYPLMNKNIVQFRDYATANGTGYQQLDIHAVDVLRTLMFIEFATLDIQSVMQGYTAGQYTATHLATVTEETANIIIVANAHAALYRVGQAISIGTSLGGNQICYNRTITAIDDYDVDNKAISFDGTAVNITAGNILYNSGWKSGACDNVVASSGVLTANDGKYPCMYRGIENPFGNMWQFVDGVNINEYQAWVCKNAASYDSNVFASPYEQLNYLNHNADGYVKTMGYDSNLPFAEFPTAITGGSTPTQYYSDYHYRAAGQRIARFGGRWNNGSGAGVSCWALTASSAAADLALGGRLLKKPL